MRNTSHPNKQYYSPPFLRNNSHASPQTMCAARSPPWTLCFAQARNNGLQGLNTRVIICHGRPKTCWVLSSEDSLAEISIMSPQKLFVLLSSKIFSGSKYPENKLFHVEKNFTGSVMGLQWKRASLFVGFWMTRSRKHSRKIGSDIRYDEILITKTRALVCVQGSMVTTNLAWYLHMSSATDTRVSGWNEYDYFTYRDLELSEAFPGNGMF